MLLCFGDDTGSPGSILTSFPWPGATRGNFGVGETSANSFSLPAASIEFWEDRLLGAGIPAENTGKRFEEDVLSFADPDGMKPEIVGHANISESNTSRTSYVPSEHAIRGFFGITLCEGGSEKTATVLATMGFEKVGQQGNRFRFAAEGDAGNHVDPLICWSSRI